MFETLDKIRKLPEQERKMIAFFVSLGLAGIVALVWFVSLFTEDKTTEVVAEKTPSLFEGIADHTSELFSGVGAQFSSFKEQIESVGSEEDAL